LSVLQVLFAGVVDTAGTGTLRGRVVFLESMLLYMKPAVE